VEILKYKAFSQATINDHREIFDSLVAIDQRFTGKGPSLGTFSPRSIVSFYIQYAFEATHQVFVARCFLYEGIDKIARRHFFLCLPRFSSLPGHVYALQLLLNGI
jgi:hypothetical protein